MANTIICEADDASQAIASEVSSADASFDLGAIMDQIVMGTFNPEAFGVGDSMKPSEETPSTFTSTPEPQNPTTEPTKSEPTKSEPAKSKSPSFGSFDPKSLSLPNTKPAYKNDNVDEAVVKPTELSNPEHTSDASATATTIPQNSHNSSEPNNALPSFELADLEEDDSSVDIRPAHIAPPSLKGIALMNTLDHVDSSSLNASETSTGVEGQDLYKNGTRFIKWLQTGLQNGSLSYNRADSVIHFVDEGMLLVTPRVFQLFTNTNVDVNKKDSPANIAQRAFESLKIHERTKIAGHFFASVVSSRTQNKVTLRVYWIAHDQLRGIVADQMPTNDYIKLITSPIKLNNKRESTS